MKQLETDASEGDVETQVVLPMLTRPEFLAISIEEIRSKQGISARDIGKGAKRKVGYVPDFCVYKYSLPTLVVEAKSPANDVHQAYAEARLYALEINRSFPTNLNPCCRIIATNGVGILAGAWDAEPSITLSVDDIAVGNACLDEFIGVAGNSVLESLIAPVTKR